MVQAVIHGGYFSALGKKEWLKNRGPEKFNRSWTPKGSVGSASIFPKLKKRYEMKRKGLQPLIASAIGRKAGLKSKTTWLSASGAANLREATGKYVNPKGKLGTEYDTSYYMFQNFFDSQKQKIKISGGHSWWVEGRNSDDEIAKLLFDEKNKNKGNYTNFLKDWQSWRTSTKNLNVEDWAVEFGLMDNKDFAQDIDKDLVEKATVDAIEEVPYTDKESKMKMGKVPEVAKWSTANTVDAKVKIGDKWELVDTTETKMNDRKGWGPHHGQAKERMEEYDESFEAVKKDQKGIRDKVATYFETKAFKEMNQEIVKMKNRVLKRKSKKKLTPKNLIDTYEKKGDPSTKTAKAAYDANVKRYGDEKAKELLHKSQHEFIFHALGTESWKKNRDFKNIIRVSDKSPRGEAFYASVPTKMFGKGQRIYEFDEAKAKGTAIIKGASGIHALSAMNSSASIGLQNAHMAVQFRSYSTAKAGHTDTIKITQGIAKSGIEDACSKVLPKVTVSFSPARINAFLKNIDKAIGEQWKERLDDINKSMSNKVKKIGKSKYFWALPYLTVDTAKIE